MKNTKVIALINQKGGVGKTTTTFSLGAAYARQGAHVLLIDADPQANLTQMMGWQNPEMVQLTLAAVLDAAIADEQLSPERVILNHSKGLDLVPSGIELANTEVSLVTAVSREHILKSFIEEVSDSYDYILIDCTPSLGMLTMNAMVAADSLIIPVVPHFLPVKGLEQMLKSVAKVQRNRHLNPNLEIDGILLTMVSGARTNLESAMVKLITEAYGNVVRVFDTQIPKSIRAAEMSAVGKSIFEYASSSNVAAAYAALADELTGREVKK